VDGAVARGLDHHHLGHERHRDARGAVQLHREREPGPEVGEITAAARTFTLTQAALIPTDFAASSYDPDIGEEVIFTVDTALVPVSWDFGSPDCG